MVYLDKLKEIRTKKRISRKKLAQDCNISEDLIKLMETIPLDEIEGYDPETIINIVEKIALRLKVDVVDLSSLAGKLLEEPKDDYHNNLVHKPIKINKNE